MRFLRATPILLLAGAAALAGAAVARGQEATLGPSLAPSITFGAGCDTCTVFQSTHPSAPALAAPFDGIVSRWRIKKGHGADWGSIRIRVLRPLGDGRWRAVRSTAPVPTPNAGGVHEFEADLPIAAGDRVGLSATNQYQGWAAASGAGIATWASWWAGGDLLDGQERPPSFVNNNAVLPLQVDVAVPSNDLRFRRPKLNRRRGTARLPVILPASGRAVLLASKRLRRNAVRATAAGRAVLRVVPRGKAKRRLARATSGGRRVVRVRARVRFTPTGGSPRTAVRRMRLVRR